jgi:hypothetical protein
MSKKNPRLEVVDMTSGEIVHTVTLQSSGPRYVEKVLTGLLMRTDTDKFFVREVDCET